MKSLTKSEKVAKNWLEKRGYNSIVKNGKRGVPDFKADGNLYEVKKIIGNSLLFTESQMDKFEEINPSIIVTEDEEVLDVLKFDKLSNKYNISVNSSMPVIRIDEESYKIVDYISRAEGSKKMKVTSEMIKEAKENSKYYHDRYERMKKIEEDGS